MLLICLFFVCRFLLLIFFSSPASLRKLFDASLSDNFPPQALVSLVRRDLRVAGYDAVLIGSGVRSGSWLPQAVAFVTDHQYALRRVPVALFRVHLNNTGTDAWQSA